MNYGEFVGTINDIARVACLIASNIVRCNTSNITIVFY